MVRTYFAVLKDTPSEQFVIKCVERGRTCSPAVLSELAIHHQSYGHPYIASLKDVFLYVSNGSNGSNIRDSTTTALAAANGLFSSTLTTTARLPRLQYPTVPLHRHELRAGL